MKLILELNNPQKLALLLEFLKDIQYIKGIKVVDNTLTQLEPLEIKTLDSVKKIEKPSKKRFNNLKLNTKSFKFNREELNER